MQAALDENVQVDAHARATRAGLAVPWNVHLIHESINTNLLLYLHHTLLGVSFVEGDALIGPPVARVYNLAGKQAGMWAGGQSGDGARHVAHHAMRWPEQKP